MLLERFAVAENDECENAQVLEPAAGQVTLGSTVNALIDSKAPFCYLPISTPSVWYRLMGTGTSMHASTCHILTTFDTRIAVYEGSACTSSKCVYANSDSNVRCEHGDDASTVTWFAGGGKTYYLLVYGAPPEASGDFGLTVEQVGAPQNDLCMDAHVIDSALGLAEPGSIVDANQDMFVPFCDGQNRHTGTWFSTAGTGGRLRVSACSGSSAS